MTVMLPLKNLKFILSWIFSKLLHDSSKLGNADVPASVNVVLKERLSLTNENHGSLNIVCQFHVTDQFYSI